MKLPTMTAALAALALACASTGASAQKTNQLSEEVKAAYAELFDAAGGNAWAKCQTSRDNPCGCATNKVSVTCKNAFIKAIKFPSNNLVGTIPTKALETLLTAGATQLDFSGNPEFVLDEYEGATCLALTQCAPGGSATCNFGSVQVCVPPTASPTLKPTTGSPTRKPTSVAPTAAPTNQAQIGWQEFFDATAGKNWNKCSKTKTTPCSCTANANQIVNCNSKGQIQNITLVSNNLVSKDFTEASLTKLIAGGVKYINVLGNTGLKTGAGKCISAAAGCGVNGVTCLFPSSVVFCVQTASPTFAPTVPTAKPTTGSPTLKPTTAKPTNKPTTPAPTAPILLYWSPFFTATGGASWTKCSGNQANPCKCNKLTCNNKGTVIQQINLNANNLVGNLPIAEINGLIAQGATVINLASNPGIVYPPGECVAVSGCVKTGVTCTFDVPACTTVAPTAAPVAATNSPTFAPIAGTAAPTVPTAAPTLATAAPTLATAAPTLATAAPTVPTAAPTGTAAPTTVTTAPTGTAAPTLPTAGPSVPASLSPTASNRTISPSVTPTNGTNGTTASPTKSAGAIAQVSYAAGSLLAAALVAALA